MLQLPQAGPYKGRSLGKGKEGQGPKKSDGKDTGGKRDDAAGQRNAAVTAEEAENEAAWVAFKATEER